MKISPGNAYAALVNGMIMQSKGMTEEALSAYKKALTLKPDFADAYNNAGNVLATSNRPGEAVDFYQKALDLRPDSYEAHNNYGHALRASGKSDEAVAYFREAVRLRPDSPETLSNLLLCLNYVSTYAPDSLKSEHDAWSKAFECATPPYTTYRNTLDRNRKLRIGYVSPDFRRHPVTSFFTPLLENSDADSFHTYCYSQTSNPDDVTDHLRSIAGQWRDISKMSDDQVAETVRSDSIDILVDLAGHTAGNRLPVFCRKPAPVQVTYLGYPCTTGLNTMDYLVTDDIVSPAGI